MPGITEGLSVGGEDGVNPNDARGFEKIMEGKGVPKEEGEGDTLSTDIRSGLTTAAEPGAVAEPFTPKDTSPPVTPDTSTGTPAVEEDPEVAALLAKYGGDPLAALKAASAAQGVIGRQGQELGQTREELAEMRGQLAALMATQSQAPAGPVLSQDEIEERAQDRIQLVGYHDAATEAANVAVTQGDERAYRTIFEQWNLEDPFAAQTHIADFRAWQREQAAVASAPAAAAEEPWVANARQQAQVDALVSGLTMIAPEYGGPEGLAPLAEHFDAAFESLPSNVQEMISSSDTEAKAAGLRIFVDRATLLAGKAPASAAAPPQEQVVPASVARKLAGAAVASGALRPVSKSTETPQTREDAIKEFKRELMETETTNVASGLTFGK